MTNNKISTGIWMVFLGLVILLHNINIIQFNFYAIIKFWPLALISVGVSLLLQGKKNGPLISTAVNLAICIFLLVAGTTASNQNDAHNYTAFYGDAQEKVYARYTGAEATTIEINGGAAKYIIGNMADSTKLFEASATGSHMHLELDEDEAKSKLELDMKIRGNDNNGAPVNLSFNQRPLWNMTFNVGAVSVDGDFSNHHIQHFTINSGASSFKLKYGMPTNGTSKIEINTAASGIKLLIPKEASYAVNSDNVISRNKINGKKYKGNSTYKSEGYDQAENKYYIEVSGAANSFSLDTY